MAQQKWYYKYGVIPDLLDKNILSLFTAWLIVHLSLSEVIILNLLSQSCGSLLKFRLIFHDEGTLSWHAVSGKYMEGLAKTDAWFT